MLGLEHETVATEGDDHVGILRVDRLVVRLDLFERRLGLFGVRCQDGDLLMRHAPLPRSAPHCPCCGAV